MELNLLLVLKNLLQLWEFDTFSEQFLCGRLMQMMSVSVQLRVHPN